ncbi:MAG: hypothetical protein KF802_02490 [Bdellovibrionaceae bacterium]|nr:hypothetical protein [Pseudobdellovibrionaceae bacterium]
MLFQIFQLYRKDGPQAVERHIESPDTSEIFKAYPSVMRNKRLVEAICDSFKVTMSTDISAEELQDYILEQDSDEEPFSVAQKATHVALVMFQTGAPPLICIEAGRKTTPYSVRPSFDEMDTATKGYPRNRSKSSVNQTSSKSITHEQMETLSPLLKEISDLKLEIVKLKIDRSKQSFAPVASSMNEDAIERLFTINDLDLIDDKGIQTALKEIPNDKLLLAMKTLPVSIRLKFFKNISSRASELLQEDLANMGPARISDVDAAQNEILEVVKRLEAEGKILIARRRDDDQLV